MVRVCLLILLCLCCCSSVDAGIFGFLFKAAKKVANVAKKVMKKAGPILKDSAQDAAKGYLEEGNHAEDDDDGLKTYNADLAKLASILIREEKTTESNWEMMEFLRKLNMPKPPPLPLFRCITVDRNPKFGTQITKPIVANDGIGSGWGYQQGYVGPLMISEICLPGEGKNLYWAVEVVDRTSKARLLVKPSYDNGSYCHRETLIHPYNVKCTNYLNDKKQFCIAAVVETVVPIDSSIRNKRFIVEWAVSLFTTTSRCTLIEPQYQRVDNERFLLSDDDKLFIAQHIKDYVNCTGFGVLAGFLVSLITFVLLATIRPEYEIYVRFSAKRMEKIKKERNKKKRAPLTAEAMKKMGIRAAYRQIMSK